MLQEIKPAGPGIAEIVFDRCLRKTVLPGPTAGPKLTDPGIFACTKHAEDRALFSCALVFFPIGVFDACIFQHRLNFFCEGVLFVAFHAHMKIIHARYRDRPDVAAQ